ncbi:hypothetical protein B0T19DRAFT_442386 [Cercophora scortea]|uniref:Oxidoreductase AflY n=1 Tax=Cercophora scortea TaxID=314031 RepID=A0AAE0IP05_9PEZI|nr:hypothetical protein B0T19DRAFT_442386 [Cercophora scortea]
MATTVSREGSSLVSPYKIHIVPEDTGLWKVPQTDEAARKASDLLQEDLEKHHVFFNNLNFHNHLSHQTLALYGTGATPHTLQKAYDNNTSYQRPSQPLHPEVVTELTSNWPQNAPKYLGRGKHYPDFLRFFQQRMDEEGGSWQAVLGTHLFKPAKQGKEGNDADDDLLLRMFAGVLHPLIQLMYGMEWNQPAIVAQALAQAAVHKPGEIGRFLQTAERDSEARGVGAGDGGMGRIVDLLEEVARGNGVEKVVGKVRVGEDEVEERTAEMFDACVYLAAAAARREGKVDKFDFFLIHHVNASPLFLTINAQPWIPRATKARLLEWKIRLDLREYAVRGAPPLALDKITAYKPKRADATGQPSKTTLLDIISRLHTLDEDGHAIKLARAAAICHELSRKYEDRDWMMVRGDDMWVKVHHLIVDSAEAPGPEWVRGAGFDEAWKDVPDA